MNTKPHVSRMEQELVGLDEKIQKLSDFMDGDVFPHLDPQDRHLMLIQSNAMRNYQSVLKQRIMREQSRTK